MALAAPSEDFLTKKAGPLPVWGWGALVLAGAWLYSKHQANLAATSSSSSASSPSQGSAEPATGAPYYVIENNIPGGGPSTPTTVATPPGTGPTPPTTTPPVSTQNPPVVAPPKPPTVTPPKPVPAPPKPAPKPAPKPPVAYKVQHGDTLTSIAKKYGTTAAALFAFNTGSSSPHSASARAELLKQGPNLIYAGQTIYVPQ